MKGEVSCAAVPGLANDWSIEDAPRQVTRERQPQTGDEVPVHVGDEDTLPVVPEKQRGDGHDGSAEPGWKPASLIGQR